MIALRVSSYSSMVAVGCYSLPYIGWTSGCTRNDRAYRFPNLKHVGISGFYSTCTTDSHLLNKARKLTPNLDKHIKVYITRKLMQCKSIEPSSIETLPSSHQGTEILRPRRPCQRRFVMLDMIRIQVLCWNAAKRRDLKSTAHNNED